jgi:hypothetical protein
MSRKVTGNEVWQWPEFQALAARLGIPQQFVTDLDIHIKANDAVRFTLAALAAVDDVRDGGTTTQAPTSYVEEFEKTSLDGGSNITGFVQ